MASLTSRDGRRSYELAGPEVLTYDDIVRTVLAPRAAGGALLHVPLPLVRASLDGLGRSRARRSSPPGRRRS